jgi:hypothetical protein
VLEVVVAEVRLGRVGGEGNAVLAWDRAEEELCLSS